MHPFSKDLCFSKLPWIKFFSEQRKIKIISGVVLVPFTYYLWKTLCCAFFSRILRHFRHQLLKTQIQTEPTDYLLRIRKLVSSRYEENPKNKQIL